MGKKLSKIDLNKVLVIVVVLFALILALGGCVAWNYVTSPGNSGLYPVKGVDISKYQGEVDFHGLKKEGISFVYMKATEGSSHQDSQFESNWESIRGSGITGGAYHFMSYDTDGNAQADNFIQHVNRRIGYLPPAIDVEFYGDYEYNSPSKEQMYEVLDVLLQRLEERYHKKPVIYTNTSIYDKYMAGRYDEYPIWISDRKVSKTLSDNREWIFCQYSFEGRFNSIGEGEKDVDLNVFRGSLWELMKYKYFDKFN